MVKTRQLVAFRLFLKNGPTFMAIYPPPPPYHKSHMGEVTNILYILIYISNM